MANRGINKAIIVGHTCADPEMRYLPSGTAVTTISVATNESWTDKNTGQKQERTEYHRIEAFGKLAEIMGQYLRKGSQVYIEGSIRTDKWQDQSGADRYSTKIRADQMQMLGGRQGGDGQAPQAPSNAQASNNVPAAFQHRPQQIEPWPEDNLNDNIPF